MIRSVAALYDIHGNLPALDAVLAELAADPPDAVVIGGDVAAGPMPVEVLARLRDLPWPVHFLRGNADRFVVMGYDGTIPPRLLEHPLYRADAWTATFISRADRDWLEALPPLLRLPVDGHGEVLFCHATPRSDEERVSVFATDERLGRILAQDDAPLLVAGHTHRQFDRTVGDRRMVNAGSVGRPYEHEPGAYWLRVGPEVELRRTPYDVEAATEAFRAVGYPLAGEMLAPVDADAVARHYEEQGDAELDPASLTGIA
jgi:predicted phosphodiesterase